MKSNTSEEEKTPGELIVRFERCANWPRDPEGVIALAQGLRKAATEYGQSMESIVDRCASLSQYCPTDYDLRTVAQEMRDDARRAAGGIQPWQRKEICQKCGGTGWEPQRPRGGYTGVARCSAGCAVPAPHGYCLSPEVLR